MVRVAVSIVGSPWPRALLKSLIALVLDSSGILSFLNDNTSNIISHVSSLHESPQLPSLRTACFSLNVLKKETQNHLQASVGPLKNYITTQLSSKEKHQLLIKVFNMHPVL